MLPPPADKPPVVQPLGGEGAVRSPSPDPHSGMDDGAAASEDEGQDGDIPTLVGGDCRRDAMPARVMRASRRDRGG